MAERNLPPRLSPDAWDLITETYAAHVAGRECVADACNRKLLTDHEIYLVLPKLPSRRKGGRTDA